jgi:hypothetical protein
MKGTMGTTKRIFISALKTTRMRTRAMLAAGLALGLALTSVRAADITPAETKTIAEDLSTAYRS